jgi:hypothetical protein
MHNKQGPGCGEAVIYDGRRIDARLTIDRQNISRLAGKSSAAPGYLAS